MPRSSYWTQQCKCGSRRRAVAAITIAASTLGTIPRRKSKAVTIYICEECLDEPKAKTKANIITATINAAVQTLK